MSQKKQSQYSEAGVDIDKGNAFVEVDNEISNVKGVIFADANFLDFFQIPYSKRYSG